jgi:hypothetical protein
VSVALSSDLHQDRLWDELAHYKNREGAMQRWVCGLVGCALMFFGASAAEAQDANRAALDRLIGLRPAEV